MFKNGPKDKLENVFLTKKMEIIKSEIVRNFQNKFDSRKNMALCGFCKNFCGIFIPGEFSADRFLTKTGPRSIKRKISKGRSLVCLLHSFNLRISLKLKTPIIIIWTCLPIRDKSLFTVRNTKIGARNLANNRNLGQTINLGQKTKLCKKSKILSKVEMFGKKSKFS